MISCFVSALFLSLVVLLLVHSTQTEPSKCDKFTDESMVERIFASKDHHLFIKTLERDVIGDFKLAAELVSDSDKTLDKKTTELVGNGEKQQRRQDAESVLDMTSKAVAYAICNNLNEKQFPGRIYSLLFEEGFQIVNDASKKEMIAEALKKAKEELKIETLDKE